MDELPIIAGFREVVEYSVEEFINASRGFGEPLTAMAYMVKRAFQLELEFISTGVRAPQPDDLAFNNNTEVLSSVIQEIQEFRHRNRHIEEYFSHLSTISESIVALSWISVRPAPAQFIRDMRDAGDYFGNRVLSTNKGNHKHANWINKWNDVLKQLEQYVRTYHLTGFAWNAAVSAGPHAPPPPPPPTFSPPSTVGFGPAGDSRSALLNQLNQGIGITRMLRPVQRESTDQGTGASPPHGANQAAGTQAPPAPAPAPAVLHRSQATTVRVYPPKFILDGRKWRVEHQKDNYSLVIDNEDMSESLAMFKCENSGLEVRNKMNGVTIDHCKHCTVVLKDIISSVDAIRCERLRIQCKGRVPLISLDSCDSVQIFITESSRNAEIIQSKSTSCNVCLLAPDGDYEELPMPEQIRTIIVDRTLQSTVVEKI